MEYTTKRLESETQCILDTDTYIHKRTSPSQYIYILTLTHLLYYVNQERKALIRKFHEKQKRRIWNKKVRYFCRKNLADTRVRIKGRFVNPEKYNKILAEQALATGEYVCVFT